MSPEAICNLLKKRFGEAIVATAADTPHPCAVVRAVDWLVVARFLRDDPQLRFNMLRCITALDLVADNKLAAVYDLVAMHDKWAAGNREQGRASEQTGSVADDGGGLDYACLHIFAVRIEVERANPHIPSVAAVWPAADWHEREAYDLMGIRFDQHPDEVSDHDGTHPRRILCPDDWEGYPLRKDYLYPLEYHGIPGTTEYELTSPKH
ncbi:MAG: NAD(P)H-quinone oxidoreductase subunit J, chloroplastic [Phycisphaerae bacterium]|nr:NAD(P)H-quinone oxidoreductase subunit J, chloroplastic [Phycisphaerae bacterium]